MYTTSKEYYCDKCKKEIKTNSKIVLFKIDTFDGRDSKELCQECYKKFLKFLKEGE